MAGKAFEGLLDWLEKAADAFDSAVDDRAAELKERLAEAGAELDRKLDHLAERIKEGLPDHDWPHDRPSGSDGDGHARSQASEFGAVSAMAAKAPPKGGNPIKVGLGVDAVPSNGDVKFKLSTKATASGKKNDVSVSSKSQSQKDKPDKLDVKVSVADWIKEKGDGDTLDFLLCVTGSKKGGAPTRHLDKKHSQDVDLIVNLDLKGMPLTAKLKSPDLMKVKCVGEKGKPGVGYFGRADDDGRTITLELSPAKGGAPVAVLALDIKAADGGRPDFPDIPDLFM